MSDDDSCFVVEVWMKIVDEKLSFLTFPKVDSEMSKQTVEEKEETKKLKAAETGFVDRASRAWSRQGRDKTQTIDSITRQVAR